MKRPRRFWKWVIGVIVALVVAVTAGPFIYIHFIEGPAPAKITFANSATGGAQDQAGLAGGFTGTWQPTSGSLLGYRVKEVLFGQSAEAVGRTNKISGQIQITGTTLSAGSLTVDMASITSDQSQRDHQFNGRVMDTSSFPTATLKITKPVDFGSLPANLATIDANVTAELTLRGTTRVVTFTVKARRNGAKIEVNGTIPIVFAEWNIPNPSFGPAETADNGVIEFLVVFTKS